jgi:hypothetical protein
MLSKSKKLCVNEGFETLPTDINEWITRFNGFRVLLTDIAKERNIWLKETKADRERSSCKKELLDMCRKYNIKKFSTLTVCELQEKVKAYFVGRIKEYHSKFEQLWMYLKTCHLYIRQLQGYTTASPEFVHLYGDGKIPITTKLEIASFDYNPNLISLDAKDIIEVICKNLSIGDIGRLMQTSKKYYHSIVDNNGLWLYLCRRDLCIRRGREYSNWFLFYKNWFTKKTKTSKWFTRDVSGKLYDVFDGKLGIFHSDALCVEIEDKGFVFSRHDMSEHEVKKFPMIGLDEIRFNDNQFILFNQNTKLCFIFQKTDGKYKFKTRVTGHIFMSKHKVVNGSVITDFGMLDNACVAGYHNEFITPKQNTWFNETRSNRRFSFDPHFGVGFDKDNLCISNSRITYRWGNYYYGLRKISDTQYFVYCCNMENHYMFRYLSDPILFDAKEVPERLWIDSERIFIQTNKNLWILK